MKSLCLTVLLSNVCSGGLIDFGLHGTVTTLKGVPTPTSGKIEVDELPERPGYFPYADVKLGDQLSVTVSMFDEVLYSGGGRFSFPDEWGNSVSWYTPISASVELNGEQFTLHHGDVLLWIKHDSPGVGTARFSDARV